MYGRNSSTILIAFLTNSKGYLRLRYLKSCHFGRFILQKKSILEIFQVRTYKNDAFCVIKTAFSRITAANSVINVELYNCYYIHTFYCC